MVVLKNEGEKCMDALGQVIGHSIRSQTCLKLKGIYCMVVYSSSQGCTVTHSHLQAGQDRIYTPDHLYRLMLCFRKAARKADHCMVACSECGI